MMKIYLYEIKEELEITTIKIQERLKIAEKLKEKGLSEEEIAKKFFKKKGTI